MRTCHRCHRLVRRVEARCPICGVELLDAPAPVAIAALGLGVAMLLACGPTKPQTTEGGSSGSSSTTTTSHKQHRGQRPDDRNTHKHQQHGPLRYRVLDQRLSQRLHHRP
ncbi:MAG: hypothetical protein IPO88_12895 [Nannocystis sp.]|uniref:hypothetical protein n=1 Tax=Nannocystis sp. TaxID=1962667 RepID=UPI002423C47D|nr:hypothetical protein [Nannocystis sp.]MBK9754381.1 hypothetical protein [Nannocystis sp.]